MIKPPACYTLLIFTLTCWLRYLRSKAREALTKSSLKNTVSAWFQRRLCSIPYIAMAEAAPAPMPRWRVDCKTCLESFTHSPVGKSRQLEDYLHPTEPEFPSGGLELTCPRCKTTATYQVSDIRYEHK